jgi:hypothetical protein
MNRESAARAFHLPRRTLFVTNVFVEAHAVAEVRDAANIQ